MTRNEVADFLREFANELDDRAVSERLRDDTTAVGDRHDIEGTGSRDREQRTEPREGRTVRYDTADADAPRSDEAIDESGDRELPDARRVTLVIGGESATVTVPEMVEFDIAVNSRSGMLSSTVTQEVDFDMSWEIEDLDEGERSIDVV